jgi:hypothetical protein
MVLRLPDDLANVLAAEAEKRGTTPEQLAVGYLRQHLPAGAMPADRNAGTMLEYLSDVIGVVNSAEIVPGGANMSQNTGKKLSEILNRKRVRGNL